MLTNVSGTLIKKIKYSINILKLVYLKFKKYKNNIFNANFSILPVLWEH